jgi:glycogen debranching enzyme
MAESESATHAKTRPARQKSPAPRRSRAASVGSIADAVVVKDEDVFFLTERDGDVPLKGNHGLGLYYHDCRYLNGYEMRLVGTEPNTLIAVAQAGYEATLALTNPEIPTADGKLIPKEDIGIKWERVIDASAGALYDRITFENYQQEDQDFPVSFRLSAGFEDIFTVRGRPTKKRGKVHPPAWHDGCLFFRYDGTDGIHRSLTVQAHPEPDERDGTRFALPIHLGPRGQAEIRLWLQIAESAHAEEVEPRRQSAPDFDAMVRKLSERSQKWLAHQTQHKSSNRELNKVLDRSLADLHVLRSTLNGEGYFAAGVPWYVTLFGRDSLISSLQTLAWEPEVAGQTLRLLAGYQGTKVDAWRDEEPGKIMHELRVGELANTDRIPQTPYYGSVDATPLFLILLVRHAFWTGSLDLFHQLKENVERALQWIDRMGDGYLTYESQSQGGLSNQGWKDSGDSIVNADGSLAKPPIALAEVQGYVYFAKTGLADLYERSGDGATAGRLRQEAADLRERFNRDFWLEDRGVYAEALQADNKPCAVVSSNAGQVLWSGIAEPDRARKMAERLLAEDMFNAWGVRTLSHEERRYNPVGYHLGTVWPHDNSLILAGLRRYGCDDAARRIFTAIVEAATYFHLNRLPEVFAGFRRDEYGVPVHYPVACHPQAWAAGSVPYMLTALLGLVPDGFGNRLHVAGPILPDGTDWLELHGLRVGPARGSLRFERSGNGVGVRVLQTEGQLDVSVGG